MAINKAVRKLMDQAPVVERHGDYFVVREDKLPGGGKMRFLPHLIDPKAELVYCGPYCGAAAICLSEVGKRTGQKVTLFYAARAELHPYQKIAKANGAKLMLIRPGYMTVLLARARVYAQKHGAQMLEPGFDMPEAEAPFVEFMERVRKEVGHPPSVWCATGSGMLARCLGLAFPKSRVNGIGVGLASHHNAQNYSKNVTIIESGYKFFQEGKVAAPFSCAPNYERKCWEMLEADMPPKKSLMWSIY